MEPFETDNSIENGLKISISTEPEKSRYGGLKKGLKTASAIIAFFCALVALTSIVALYFGVIDGFDGSGGYTTEQSNAVVGLAILGIVFAICMVIVSLSCVGAGLLFVTNPTDDKVKHIWGAVMGVFDVLAIILVSVCGVSATVLNGQWFYVFIVPFAVDLVMRVICVTLCIVLKEKENG